MSKVSDTLNRPHGTAVIGLVFLGLSLVMFFPYINSHYHFDDFFFFAIMDQKLPWHPLLGFWKMDITSFEGFHSMWWMDQGKNLGAFFRPVPSLVLMGFYSVFGRDAAIPMHLTSIVLHALAALTVYRMFWKLSGRKHLALLAGFLFLVSEDHSLTVGWISTITDILAVIFMNLSLYWYFDYRQTGRGRSFAFSLPLLVLALGSKETAVVTPLAVVLYDWVQSRDRSEFWRKGRAWGLVLGIGIAYLVFYKVMGFGAENLLYANPMSDPGRYLRNVVTGLPIMFAGAFSPAPIGLAMFYTGLAAPFMVLGWVLFLLFLAGLYPFRNDRTVRFCLILFVVSLLPQMGTDASERLFYFPFVPASFLIALLISQVRVPGRKFLARRFPEDTGNQNCPCHPVGQGKFSTVMGYYFLVTAVVVSVVVSVVQPYSFRHTLDFPERVTLASKALTDSRNPNHIVFLNTPGGMATVYVKEIYRFHTGHYQDIQLLSSFNGKVWVKQASDRSIALKTDRAGWLSNFFGRVVRTRSRIDPGRKYENELFTATVLQTTADQRDVLEVRFDFIRPLSNPDTMFLYYDGTAMKEWRFDPKAAGQWIFAGDSSDVLGAMKQF